MKTLTGGLLMLAASILVGADAIAQGLVSAAGRGHHSGPAPFLAFLVGLFGLIVLCYGLAGEGGPPAPPSDDGA